MSRKGLKIWSALFAVASGFEVFSFIMSKWIILLIPAAIFAVASVWFHHQAEKAED